ncbi:MAG: rhodanese-related sulfurtransferase [Phototrophicaceae bacterium]
MNDTSQIVIVAFYKFVPLPDFHDLKAPLLDLCKANGIYGTILLAEEGINSTIAGTRAGIDMVLDSLQDDPRFADLTVKKSYADFIPFQKMKVRLKQEIVRLKIDGIDPNEKVGIYVEPNEWNALISDPDVVVIDTRNDYEVKIGTFQNAINPHTDSFNELPDFVDQTLDPKKHKKVAMFCTGGIRCEKATAMMLDKGFEEVYHLNGGILRYLELMQPDHSLWEGECFVFDDRITVDHHLAPGKTFICDYCKEVVNTSVDICPHCGAKVEPLPPPPTISA